MISENKTSAVRKKNPNKQSNIYFCHGSSVSWKWDVLFCWACAQSAIASSCRQKSAWALEEGREGWEDLCLQNHWCRKMQALCCVCLHHVWIHQRLKETANSWQPLAVVSHLLSDPPVRDVQLCHLPPPTSPLWELADDVLQLKKIPGSICKLLWQSLDHIVGHRCASIIAPCKVTFRFVGDFLSCMS